MSEQTEIRNLDKEPAVFAGTDGPDEVRVRVGDATEVILKKLVWESLPRWSGPTPV
jgi:hypothetical protein